MKKFKMLDQLFCLFIFLVEMSKIDAINNHVISFGDLHNHNENKENKENNNGPLWTDKLVEYKRFLPMNCANRNAYVRI